MARAIDTSGIGGILFKTFHNILQSNSLLIACSLIPFKKNALYLSVYVFSTKVLIGDTIFYVNP